MSDSWKTKEELVAELNALRARVASLSAVSDAPSLFASASLAVDDFLSTARAVVAEVDDEGRLLYVSPTITDVLGYAGADYIGKSMFDWFDDPTRVAALDQFLQIMRAGVTTRYTFQARHAEGRSVWLETVCSPYRAKDGRARTISVTHDVTRLKETGDELQRSEGRYRAIAENASDLIAEVDASGRVLFVSANSEVIVGRAAEALIGRTLEEIGFSEQVHANDRGKLIASLMTGTPNDGEGREVEFRYRHPDGTWHWIHAKAQVYRRDDGAIRAVVVARDVTERIHAQEELHRSEERYRIVTEASRDIVTELDSAGRIVYSSPNIREILGYDAGEVIGSNPFDFAHSDDTEEIVRVFTHGIATGAAVRSGPFRARHRDGTWRWVEGVGIPYEHETEGTRYLTVSRDITDQVHAQQERREFEARLLRTQKLESLGVLAGGVAHDFNNLLTPILGDASLALIELDEASPVRARLQRIQKAAHRAAALTNQMLAYAGAGPLVSEPLDLTGLVEEMGQLLQTAVNASLDFELDADLPPVKGDSAQLSQVVMNLITNAAESLGPEGGRISLRTGVVDASDVQPFLAGAEPVPIHGAYVFVEVVDSGCGMDEETRAKIFDPFFTTKFTGRGLGLAAVLGIVRGHRGLVEIDTEFARGTRFRVLFPVCSESLGEPRRPTNDAFGWRSSGTLLIVDDDDGVRDLAADTLERTGIDVVCASDGREGLELFRKMTHEIRLVLLDRTMPHESGEQVFEEMQRVCPTIPILLISGFSETRALSQFGARGPAGFLQKPFMPDELIDAVRRILDPRAPRRPD